MNMSLLYRTDLLQLKYQALQRLAKREGIKANSRKDVLVDLLSRKYPDGIRRHSPSPQKTKKELSSPDLSPRPLKRQRTSPSPDANQSVRSWVQGVISAPASPTPSPGYPGPFRIPSPIPSPARIPNPIFSPAHLLGTIPGPHPDHTSPPPNVYSLKGARRVRRDLTELANESAVIHVDLRETEALLDHATNICKEVAHEVKGILARQRAMQTLYGMMKNDRTILDGTNLMDSPDREAWRAHAMEEDRLDQEHLIEQDERLYNEQVARTEAVDEADQSSAFSVPKRSPFSPGTGRFYTQPPPQKARMPTNLAPKNDLPRLDGHNARHEVHEGSAAVSIPFNPPGGGAGPNVGGSGGTFSFTRWPLLDAALTTVIGLGMVFGGGVAYVAWYKKRVLDKIEDAFAAGYDPALELATHQTKRAQDSDQDSGELQFDEEAPWTANMRRREQDTIDRIVQGQEPGHYFVLLGPKGSGKGTMIFESMITVQAEGVSMCDAHPDLEVFRLRLGKTLNFEFNEDSQTGLFQRRDPREGGPALDIERALNKLEKVALRSARKTGRPLVLIINNIHFFKNDDEGRNMILQLQQKAEAWAASGILTMVFSSDDFWPFHIMRKTASRMHVLSIYDLDTTESLHAATRMRLSSRRSTTTPEDLKEAVSLVGGRLSYLNRIAKAKDAMDMAQHLKDVEKAWLLSQIGLISDCDDDVMDEQKWSSCSWLLLQEFVKIQNEKDAAREAALAAGEKVEDSLELPVIPYWRCRQIMTRADFMEELDRINVIAIDIHHNVRPDSMLILHAAKEVVSEEDFQEVLDGVRDRIDEIESLHRTRELTFKDVNQGDRINVTVDKGGGNIIGGRIV
ncbi:hypothetical protein DXG01_004963 [Tephrocybe rancida]|nr:hypothetical protein DXG01_004963 [Tephrocybe rancida]